MKILIAFLVIAVILMAFLTNVSYCHSHSDEFQPGEQCGIFTKKVVPQ